MRTWQIILRARRGILPVAISLLLVACGCGLIPDSSSNAVNTSGSPTANSNAEPAARVVFCDNANPGCAGESTFSASTLRDLNIVVTWKNLSVGHHAQAINIVHPGGGLYQTFRTSFLTDKSSAASQTTTDALPVAGTWIVQRSMLGEWKVQVMLDGRQIATQSVILTR